MEFLSKFQGSGNKIDRPNSIRVAKPLIFFNMLLAAVHYVTLSLPIGFFTLSSHLLLLSLYTLGFISSHLTVNKLFPVNPKAITGPPKMSLLLEAKSMPALIIKPRLILVWYITCRQQADPYCNLKTSTGRSLLHHRQCSN